MTKDKLMIITNNKGKRIAKRQRITFAMDPITVTSQIDAETLAKVTIREDFVMSLKFSDGSFAVFFEDGTRIYTSADKNTFFIESPGYSPVRIFKDPIKARQNTIIGLGSSDSGLGAEDIMLRSNDGVLIETVLPNETKVASFVQKQELEAYNQFATNRINLVTRKDGTIIKTTQEGEIVFITTETRTALANNSGANAYFYDIFTLPEERNSGVYTVRVDTGRLWTKDNEGNYFEVSTSGKAVERLAVSLNVEDSSPESPYLSEGEFIDPECKFLPPPATIIPPKLFIIKNDEATELMEESQLLYYFTNSKGKYRKEETNDYVSHSWEYKKTINEKFYFPQSPFLTYSLPKVVSPLLQTLVVSDQPKPVSFVFRRIFEYLSLDFERRKEIESSLEQFNSWNNKKAQEKQSFTINDTRTENDKIKYNTFVSRLQRFRGYEEQKIVEKDSDKASEYIVSLSDEEDLPIQIEYKLSNFKMDSLN